MDWGTGEGSKPGPTSRKSEPRRGACTCTRLRMEPSLPCQDNDRYHRFGSERLLVMSGTTAVPAAAQNSTEVAKGGWSTQVAPSYVGALPKNATADTPGRGQDGSGEHDRQGDPEGRPFPIRSRSTTRNKTPNRRSTSAVPKPRSSHLARWSWVASNTPPAQYDESSTLFGALNPLLPASPSTATGGRRSPSTTTTARKLPRSPPG